MGTRVNVQSLIEANLNTSILSANSLPPKKIIGQELSTTTFVDSFSLYKSKLFLAHLVTEKVFIWADIESDNL